MSNGCGLKMSGVRVIVSCFLPLELAHTHFIAYGIVQRKLQETLLAVRLRHREALVRWIKCRKEEGVEKLVIVRG